MSAALERGLDGDPPVLTGLAPQVPEVSRAHGSTVLGDQRLSTPALRTSRSSASAALAVQSERAP